MSRHLSTKTDGISLKVIRKAKEYIQELIDIFDLDDEELWDEKTANFMSFINAGNSHFADLGFYAEYRLYDKLVIKKSIDLEQLKILCNAFSINYKVRLIYYIKSSNKLATLTDIESYCNQTNIDILKQSLKKFYSYKDMLHKMIDSL